MTERVDEIRMVVGELIADRYRLTAPVRDDQSQALWHAEDVILGRQVAVRLVCGPTSRLTALHAAAARAGRLVHDGIAAVYDTDRADNCVYVVREWVPGQSLAELLAAGALEPQMVSEIGVQLADVLAAVVGAGLHHRRAHLRNVIVTPNGGIKLTDVETADVLDARHAPEARWFGGILYGALTARWPYVQLPAPDGLAQAVTGDDGLPRTPSQLRAGVPTPLDVVTMRALVGEAFAAETVPADVLRALADPLRALPRAAPAARGEDAPPVDDEEPDPTPHRRPLWLGITLAALIVGVVVWAAVLVAGPNGRLPLFNDKPAPPSASANSSPSATASQPTSAAFTIVGIRDYDPQGNDGRENPQNVQLAINGKVGDGWTTQGYQNATLGNLKSGVGLVIDLGAEVSPREVTVTFGTVGTSWELRTADSLSPALDATHKVADGTTDAAMSHAAVPGGTKSRFWVIWLTRLPPGDGGFRGDVREIAVS